MSIKINYEKCCFKDGQCATCSCGGACDGCVTACPVNAITRDDVVKIDENLCINCGACVASCKHGALSME